MRQLSILGNLAETEEFGPDPVMLRKRGMSASINKKFENYKKKVDDPAYMEYAINKIAMEISHFIQK